MEVPLVLGFFENDGLRKKVSLRIAGEIKTWVLGLDSDADAYTDAHIQRVHVRENEMSKNLFVFAEFIEYFSWK